MGIGRKFASAPRGIARAGVALLGGKAVPVDGRRVVLGAAGAVLVAPLQGELRAGLALLGGEAVSGLEPAAHLIEVRAAVMALEWA